MVKLKSVGDRVFYNHKNIKDKKEKLKQLTDASKLPAFMGELLLAEIKISTDKANKHLRERVKMLGL